MAITSRALYAYTNISVELTGTVAGRALYAFTDISGYPQTIDGRALYIYTIISNFPAEMAARAFYAYTNVTSFTDLNDPPILKLLDANLSVEHILPVTK